MRVFPTLFPFIYPHYKNMKKTLLALSLAAVSAVTVADIPESNGKSEYKVFAAYVKGKATTGNLKEKQRTPSIGFCSTNATVCVLRQSTPEAKTMQTTKEGMHTSLTAQ